MIDEEYAPPFATGNCRGCEGTGNCVECGGEGWIDGESPCRLCGGNGMCVRCEGSTNEPTIQEEIERFGIHDIG